MKTSEPKDLESVIASSLRTLGLRSGDVVGICLPDIPELQIAITACAELNTTVLLHPIQTFSETSLNKFLTQSKIRLLFIPDWSRTDAGILPCKAIADQCSVHAVDLEMIVMVRHLNRSTNWLDGRDVMWDTLLEK